MKVLTLILTLLVSGAALAHHDDMTQNQVAHDLFHSLWWVVLALVVYRGVVWYRNKNKNG